MVTSFLEKHSTTLYANQNFHNFHIRTVQYLDIIEVLFIHQLMY